MRKLTFILLLLAFPFIIFSNNIKAEQFLKQAKALQKSKKFDEALLIFQKAEVEAKTDPVDSERQLFSIYKAFGACHLGKENFDESLKYYKKSEDILSKQKDLNPKEVGTFWDGYGDLYLAKQEYEKVATAYLNYCEAVKDIKNSDPVIEELFLKNKNAAGTCYLFVGKMVKAKEVFLELIKELPKNKYLAIEYDANSRIGYAYDELGDYDKAIEHWEFCEKINEKLPKKQTTATNNLGGLYYVTKKDFNKAEYYFKQIIEMKKTDKDIDASYAAKNLCTIYFQNKEYDKAYKYIDIALKNAMELYGPEEVLTNEILSEKGRILMLKGQVKAGEQLFAQANKNLGIDPNDKSTYENIPYTMQLYNVILQQAKAYMELYERTKDVNALKEANARADISIAIVDSARSSLSSADTDSKRGLMWSASAVFQIKIKILEYLYKETKDIAYLNNAFELFEKTNNFILLEAVLKNEVANRIGLPQEIFDKEGELTTNLAEAETKLYEHQLANPNDKTGIQEVEKIVANHKAKYQAFLKELEKNHSNYFRLNYSDEVVDINQLQSRLLNDDQTLIHYYISEDEIHCIAITKEETDFFHIPNTQGIVKDITTLRKGILEANKDKSSDAGLSEMVNASHDLYTALIKSIKVPLKQNLIIIPMGELAYIPFDVLLKEKPSDNSEFIKYNFLLKDHAISYGYSSTLLADANNKKVQSENSANFVGFAPEFNSTKIASTRSEMVSLAHNTAEVNQINSIIGGDVFTKLDATKEKFMELCGKYKILHLATHGVSNADKGENSYLAFSEDHTKDRNNLLYARDIYNLNLDSDLVVLSACETAMGELQLGEGIISLARAFTYAGARSNLTTLWQVNDQAASILMQNFYKELKSGIPKDKALQNAKLAYMENCPNEYAHPFYWSAFIPTGDMSSMKLESPTNYLQFGLTGIGGIALLCFGYFFVKKRNE